MKRLLLALTLAATLVGCSTSDGGRRWVRSEIHFGLSRPDGSSISQEDWQKFMDDVVTPAFPAGLSVVDSRGQWRNASGHIDKEPSKVLVLLHPRAAEVEQRIDEIRSTYCRRFQQEAVMKVTSPARVQF